MRYTEERYISLLTDFGFKRIFGTDPNKDLLIDFLNSLFDGEQVVKSTVSMLAMCIPNARQYSMYIVKMRKARGFIVEMQNASQQYFKDRSLYYATFPIR